MSSPQLLACAKCGDIHPNIHAVPFQYGMKIIGVVHCRYCDNMVAEPIWGFNEWYFRPVIELWNKQHQEEGTPV